MGAAVRRWVLTVLATLASLVLMASPAGAQTQPVPPEHYTLDPRGVDLVTGMFAYSASEVVIGQPGAGGLAYGRVYLGGGWRDGFLGTITTSGFYTVSVGGESEQFTKIGSVFTPVSNAGATLTQSGSAYTFTSATGAVSEFFDNFSGDTSNYGTGILLKSYTAPNGERLDYNYFAYEYCHIYNPEVGCQQTLRAVRLQSVTNNFGYQIHYAYGSLGPDDVIGDSQALISVTGINMAVDYCDPLANLCTGLTQTWPSVAYGFDPVTGEATVTDQAGRVTRYGPGTGGTSAFTVRAPGATIDDLTVTNDLTGKTTQVSGAFGTWNYSYTDLIARATTVVGPLGQEIYASSDLNIGRATSVMQITSNGPSPTTRQWFYHYDAEKRLDLITNPEGDAVAYAYNSRGQVTTITNKAKPDPLAPLPDIISSIGYQTSCTSPVTAKNCNQPISTTDARSNVTNYEWSPLHGGLLSVTSPAPTPGAVRPQVRTTYAAQSAYYKNSSGVIVISPTSVTLPVSTSACAVGAVAPPPPPVPPSTSCLDTTDETRTTIVYGAASVANNLLPTRVTSGDGLPTGGLKVNTDITYDHNGDVLTVNGPLAGTDDTTQYVYNLARQPVGIIGPDPDGAGALLNRAQKVTYDATSGLALRTEVGTTSGYNLGTFTTLRQAETVYDSWRRPVVSEAQDAAGTTLALRQVSYDAAGRPACVAQRMNPAVFGGFPAISACTQGTLGSYGPDRIVQTTYDAASRPVSTTSGVGTASTITEAVTYTANGLPQNLTDGAGNVSILVYDRFDRTSRLRYPNATGGGTSTTDYEEYAYDATSNVISTRTRGGQTFFAAYDALNRLTGSSAPLGTAAADYTYDNLNRLVGLTDGATPLAYVYDALSRPTSETGPLGTVSYQYDLASRRTAITWPGSPSFVANYEYNLGNDLVVIRENGATTGPGVLATFVSDNLGRRTAVYRGNGANSAYGYDGLSRLNVLGQDPAGVSQDVYWTYSYNPAGQITSRVVSNAAYVATAPFVGTTYANNGLNQVTGLTGTGATSLAYDGNQNITTGLGPTYGYDARNQLTTAGASSLAYDPAGRLMQVGAGGTTSRFLYDGVQAIGEYDAGGTMTARYVPGLGLDDVVTSYAGSGTSGRTWLLADERQSVVALTDGLGAAGTVNLYDEYGVPGSGNVGRFQYTGQMWLPGADLYHYRARAYAPQIGRFLQTDPIGYAAGTNLYAYVGNDPLNSVDPTGLIGELIDLDECTARRGRPVPRPRDMGEGPRICDTSEIYLFGNWLRFGDPSGDEFNPWDFAIYAALFGESSRVINCAAGAKAGGINDATLIGGWAHDSMRAVVGPSGQLAFGVLTKGFEATGVITSLVESNARNQSGDVAFVNAGLPVLGGFMGGAIGSLGGGGAVSVATGVIGGVVGERMFSKASDQYAKLRGQYCA